MTGQPFRLVHACSVCGRPIAAGRLMCHRDWRQVPQTLQRAVLSTWGCFINRKSPQQGLCTLADYRKAADAATDYVVGLSSTTGAQPQPQLLSKDAP